MTKATIFIVDDSPSSSTIIRDYLQNAGFRVLVDTRGESALSTIAEIKPDLILLDVMMPGLDGLEVCRRLKARPETAAIPVIFLTVQYELADKAKGFQAGGVDYLTKPIQMAEVLMRVNTHLNLGQLQQQLQSQVEARTADLVAEIARREQREQDKDQLLTVVRNQSDQLRAMSQWLTQEQQLKFNMVNQILQEQLEGNLKMLTLHIEHAFNFLARHNDISQNETFQQHLKHTRTLLHQIQLSVDKVKANMTENQPSKPSPYSMLKLSKRERETLKFLVMRKSSTEIAEILHISVNTVRTYRQRLMKKFNVTDMPSLIKIALDNKLV